MRPGDVRRSRYGHLVIVILLPECLFQCHACENKVKAAVVAKPVEECDLEPQKVGFWFPGDFSHLCHIAGL